MNKHKKSYVQMVLYAQWGIIFSLRAHLYQFANTLRIIGEDGTVVIDRTKISRHLVGGCGLSFLFVIVRMNKYMTHHVYFCLWI